MKFESPRFGVVEVPDDDVVHFERGLPGFPECTKFVVMEHDIDTPLKWLQCADRPEIAFLVIEPEQIMPSYEIDVPKSILSLIGWESNNGPGDVAVFVILNAQESELTANLRAPVVVNVKNRRAHQMILDDPELPVRHVVEPNAA